MRRALLAVAVSAAAAAAVVAAPAPARAQSYPAITDRDFSLDLTVGNVFGSIRTIGMGGASVAMVEQASGMTANPAAPAVRRATSNDWWDWDVSVDWINPDLGDDVDNDGQPDGDGHTEVITAGLAVELNHAGVGADVTAMTRIVDGLEIDAIVVRLLLAYAFPGNAVTVGLGFRGGSLALTRDREALVNGVAWSGTAGLLWRPPDLDLRVGAALSLPVVASMPACELCGIILPEKVRLPWEVAIGGAWRFGPTRWNRQVDAEFRDERALTVALDVVVTGPLANAYGVQRFAEGELQQSGRTVAVSLRGGAEVEAIPGWLRARGGAYWEPARLEDARGRVHGTLGLELRLFAFHVWGLHGRVRISLTADVARDYGNGGLSVGFW